MSQADIGDVVRGRVIDLQGCALFGDRHLILPDGTTLREDGLGAVEELDLGLHGNLHDIALLALGRDLAQVEVIDGFAIFWQRLDRRHGSDPDNRLLIGIHPLHWRQHHERRSDLLPLGIFNPGLRQIRQLLIFVFDVETDGFGATRINGASTIQHNRGTDIQ